MTGDVVQEWQDPVFVIEVPVGGFIEPMEDATIFMYRDILPQQGLEMQEALYARAAPPGYKVECDEVSQRWRHVTS